MTEIGMVRVATMERHPATATSRRRMRGSGRRPGARAFAVRWLLLGACLQSPVSLAAQDPVLAGGSGSRCSTGPAYGTLGVSALSCRDCTIRFQDETGTAVYRFSTEPEVSHVEEGGPAEGILEPGDRLVALDGVLITTREGGRRYGAVRPGEWVLVRYRRNGTLREAAIEAGARCRTEEPGPAPTAPPRPTIPQAPPPGVAAPAPVAPADPPAMPPPLPPPSVLSPEGYLGFSFGCSQCGYRIGGAEGRGTWFFSGPLEIEAVDPGGPGERAGIRTRDRVTAIDGLPIASPEAGARFGAIAPGDSVQLTVFRQGGSTAMLMVVAGERVTPAVAPVPDVAASPRPPATVPGTLRFVGSVGPVDVEVRGAPVNVMSDEAAGVLIIRSADVEVRVRVSRRDAPPGL